MMTTHGPGGKYRGLPRRVGGSRDTGQVEATSRKGRGHSGGTRGEAGRASGFLDLGACIFRAKARTSSVSTNYHKLVSVINVQWNICNFGEKMFVYNAPQKNCYEPTHQTAAISVMDTGVYTYIRAPTSLGFLQACHHCFVVVRFMSRKCSPKIIQVHSAVFIRFLH